MLTWLKRLWSEDPLFMASTNIAMGLLMILMPHARTAGAFYKPARVLLDWLPIYPFYIYGVVAIVLGLGVLAMYYRRPIARSLVLALGVTYWAFFALIFLAGLVSSDAGLGLIEVLLVAQFRRHAILPTARAGHATR